MTTPTAGKDVEDLGDSHIAAGILNCHSCFGKNSSELFLNVYLKLCRKQNVELQTKVKIILPLDEQLFF